MGKHKSQKHSRNVSWCDGYGEIDRHPTERRIKRIESDGITLMLCPTCTDDFYDAKKAKKANYH